MASNFKKIFLGPVRSKMYPNWEHSKKPMEMAYVAIKLCNGAQLSKTFMLFKSFFLNH